jgi:hypothetical protein
MRFVGILAFPKKNFLWLELEARGAAPAKQGLGQGAGLERKVVSKLLFDDCALIAVTS